MDTITGIKKKLFLWSGVIILVTMLSYIPAMRGGYIWDDDSYITENTTLRTPDGLRRIWLEPRVKNGPFPWWIGFLLPAEPSSFMRGNLCGPTNLLLST